MKNVIALLSMFFCYLSLFSQISITDYKTPVIIPQAPEVASLLRYSEVPVSHYNGIPNIGVPIYTLQGRELSAPINLSYHAGGYRVNEEASWVGLGWSLSAGGQITRTVRGYPDDSTYGFVHNPYTVAIVKQACNPESGDPPVYNPNNYTYSCSYYTDNVAVSNRYDYEPDDFNYNMFGQSGRFMFNQKRQVNPKGEIVQFPNENVNIVPTFDTNGIITGWKITDTNGIIYEFEEGNSYQSSETFQKKNGQFEIPLDGGDAHSYIETWNLVKVTSPNGDVITLEYERPILAGYETAAYNDITTDKTSEAQIIHDGTQSVNEHIANYTITKRNYKILTKITSSKGYVEFVRATSDRLDMQSPKQRLEFIKVFNNQNEELQRIKLVHDYFVSTPSSEPEFIGGSSNTTITGDSFINKRLYLKEVIFQGMYQGYDSTKDYSYKFDYNTSVALPHKRSYEQDHWGYYNGASGNTTLIDIPDELSFGGGANREANPLYSDAYILNKITYPEGGVTKLSYENNRGDIKDLDIPPYLENSISLSALPTNAHSISENGNTTTYKFYDTFTISNDAKPVVGASNKTQVSYTGFSNRCDNVDSFYTGVDNVCNDMYLKIYNNDTGGLLHTASIWESGFIDLFMGGTYKIEIEITSTNDNYSLIEHYSEATVKWFDENTNPPDPDLYFDYFGGLRVQAIKTYDKTKLTSYKSFEYHGGYVLSMPEYFAMSSSGSNVIQKLVSQSWIPLITTQSGYMGYRNVKEKIHQVAVETGYSTLSTTSDESREITRSYSYFPDQGDYSIAFPGAPYAFNWIPGRILREEIVGKSISDTGYMILEGDGTGDKLEIWGLKIDGNYRAERYSVENLGAIQTCMNGGNCDLGRNLYKLWPGELLTSSQKVISKEGVKELTSQTNMFYESIPSHHNPTRTVTTDSKGDTYETIIRYPYEENHTQLLAENRLNVPLNTKQYKDSELMMTAVTTYASFTGSDPVNNPTNLLLQSMSAAKKTNALEERVTYHGYNKYGQVREVSKTDGTHITYLWGYNYNYPVAKIENATYTEIASIVDETTIQNLTDTTLTNTLDALRAGLPNAMVTTYVFEPMIGMTQSIDPRGRNIYYQYDTMGRLQYVLDHDGNVLSQNNYHYKNN
ncbi:hypothetical protein [Kordia zhangzhouensis]|uniref:hypothetical protein n=1 Tax=Kordia zhangzhouensis TaxID=1620405 RepID=UPI000AE6F090|nr:hypothetical protein [Kordia zhangzhouensis]